MSYSHHIKTGNGHYSPLGAYHAPKGLVLILDVVQYKYPFHWVPVDALWEAMNAIDKEGDISNPWVSTTFSIL